MAARNLPGRVAALDLGEAYTGVAISDPGGALARPLEVVPSGQLTEYLRGLLVAEAVSEVVVGVPKTMGGEVGFQARITLEKLDVLREAFLEVRFVEWDERLTTRIARSRGPGARSGARKRRGGGSKERVDHLAAAAMLQEYLDRGREFASR